METPAFTNEKFTEARDRRVVMIGAAMLALMAFLAYANSFSVPLILDDWVTIQHNPALRKLWPIWSMFNPAETTGVGGRPIANASFVLNYAMSGTSLLGLHFVNLAIHLMAGFALFGVVRRTLLRPALRARWGDDAGWVALIAAAIWLLHPIQTQSVTYVSQRTESLMGLFYFLTLYGFIRGVEEQSPRRWLVFSWACCLAGMGTKEGMVTAPVMILLYDFTFVAGSWSELWRRRSRFHLATACSWVLLAVLMRGLHGRGVGFGQGMSAWSYWLIECRAIVRYAWLAIWPAPLVFDYGIEVAAPAVIEILSAAGLILFGAWMLFLFRRSPAKAFPGAWFLVTLAPTSSIVPIPLQPISENRVYVPIAAIITALVVVFYGWLGRRFIGTAVALLIGLTVLTAARNADYRSEVSIWTDTVAKRPESSRAHNNLGHALLGTGRLREARAEIETALGLKPDYVDAHVNLASAVGPLGMVDTAIEHARRATQLDPVNANAYYNLGVALVQKGETAAAIAAYEAALRIRPESAEARGNLGILMLRVGRLAEAISQCEIALRLNPQLADARLTFASALSLSGRLAEAVPHFQDVLRVQPNNLDAHFNLGVTLQQLGRPAEAAASFETVLRLNPNHAGAHFNLANAFVSAGRSAEAVPHYESVLRTNPNATEALVNLGLALANLGRRDEAIIRLEAALKINPNLPAARETLDKLRANVPAKRE